MVVVLPMAANKKQTKRETLTELPLSSWQRARHPSHPQRFDPTLVSGFLIGHFMGYEPQ